jgi:hypothetical protein
MKAITGRKTLQEIAAEGAERPIEESQWKMQILDGASELPAGEAHAIEVTVQRPRGDIDTDG